MTDSRETVWKKRQTEGKVTHCKHPLPEGICAAYVKAGSPHPGVCDEHAKDGND